MESEKALLEQWRTYRVETLTAPDISWPGKPKQKHPRYSGDYQENFRGVKA
ncbi:MULTISPECIES: tail fiber assembly protein [unclassified Pantoea]